MSKSPWLHQMPVYCTRENADGVVGSVSLAFWVVFPLLVLGTLNAFLWSIYGIITVLGLIF